MDITEILATMPQAPQRQDSTHEQLRDLIALANRAGMYDAADFLKVQVAATDARLSATGAR